jgi:hypothetical protein
VTSYHDVVRAAYALDCDDDAWVDGLARSASELFGGDVLAYVIRPDAMPDARIGAFSMLGTAFLQQVADGRKAHLELPTEALKSMYGGGPFVGLWSERASHLRENADAVTADFLDFGDEAQRLTGNSDTIGAFCGSASGGCMLCVATTATTLSPRTRWALRRMAVHIEAAFRLRERPHEEPDALLDEKGAILERRVSLEADVESIGHGAREMKEAASRAQNDPEGALSVWRGLIAGRWSLVESKERSGRRTLLLRRNELPESRGDDAVACRAASVAGLVARGHSNKFIAYELGLPISTVASDIRRVLSRLGLSRRGELIRLGPGGAAG